MATRTRLSREDRSDQLLDLGAELFASRSYEDVHIEEIAELAEVSRGLLYHYYPTKRAFFAALVRREAARMIELTQPDPSLGVVEQLSFGIEAYLRHCKEHAQGVKVVYSGWGSVDPEVRQIIHGDLRIQEDRIVAAVSPDKPATRFLRIGVRGWLAFTRSACHDWLDSDDIPLEDVRDMCTHALVATLLALPEDSRPSALVELVGGDLSR
ncbi:MAG: TetR/AcrR family transcriptional regulator [Aeromicrobium sp.]